MSSHYYPPKGGGSGSKAYSKSDASNWNGSATTVTYTVSSADDSGNTIANAYQLIWALKDVANSYAEMQGCTIDHPTQTQVRFTFGAGFPPASGTYLLVGR